MTSLNDVLRERDVDGFKYLNDDANLSGQSNNFWVFGCLKCTIRATSIRKFWWYSASWNVLEIWWNVLERNRFLLALAIVYACSYQALPARFISIIQWRWFLARTKDRQRIDQYYLVHLLLPQYQETGHCWLATPSMFAMIHFCHTPAEMIGDSC